MADEEAAGPVVAESPERVFALVDHRDIPAGLPQFEGDSGADAAAADDDHLHGLQSSRVQAAGALSCLGELLVEHAAAGTRRSGPRTAPSGAGSRRSARRSAPAGASAARSRRRSGRRRVSRAWSTIAARSPARGRSCRSLRRRSRRRAASPPRARPRACSSCVVELRVERRGRAGRERRGAPRPSLPCSAGELDRGRDHLLADDPELHRHEDPPEVRHVRREHARRPTTTRCVRPSPCERRTATKTTRPRRSHAGPA